MSIVLYDYWRSSAAYRLRITLNLMGLDYTAVPVDLLTGRSRRQVLRSFEDIAQRLDLERVDAVGLPFDPNVHDAIQQAETDEQPPGTVMSEILAGYRLGGKLLRAAMVVVARPPSAPGDDDAS